MNRSFETQVKWRKCRLGICCWSRSEKVAIGLSIRNLLLEGARLLVSYSSWACYKGQGSDVSCGILDDRWLVAVDLECDAKSKDPKHNDSSVATTIID